MTFPKHRPSKIIIYAVTAIVGFWTMALFIDAKILRDIFNNLSLGIAVVWMLHWLKAAIEAVRGRGNGQSILILAIFLAGFVFAYSRSLSIASILLDRPPWLIDGPLAAFLPYMVTGLGIMFIIAPGVADGASSRWYFKHILIAVALGSGVTGFMLAYTFK